MFLDIAPHFEGSVITEDGLMAPPTKAGVNQKLVNRITARIIPTCLAAIVGYVTYIVIVVVCGQ